MKLPEFFPIIELILRAEKFLNEHISATGYLKKERKDMLMVIKERNVQLKNGRSVLLKSALPEHAKALCRHRYITSGETHFMARYPEECGESTERMRERLESLEKDERDFLVTAFLDGEIIGDAGVTKIRNHVKSRHRCYFGISVLQEYTGLGLGGRMLELALEQAWENGFEQMELGVFSDNERAIRLYEKYGFQKTGVSPRAFKLKDGTYRDEILMVRMKEEDFFFYDTEDLENEEIKLVLERTAGEDREKGYLPAYYFAICNRDGVKMGICDLRIGYNENTYYGGNIGYEIQEEYRGRHYAGKACLLLFELARKHGMKYLIITCSPGNTASRRTCEYAGGVLKEIAELPESNEMRQEGVTEKCIYRFEFEKEI